MVKAEVIESLTIKSPDKEETEDAYFINEKAGLYGVLDGATPITDYKDEDGHNGAYLAAQLFKGHMEKVIEGTLRDRVVEANRLLRQKMKESQVDLSLKHHLWSTCVAGVKVGSHEVEYVQLGDSMVIAGFCNGDVEVLTKDTVKDISKRAREKREEERKLGIEHPDEEYFRNIRHALIFNRSLANKAQGYSVANGMDEAESFMQTGSLSRENLRYILLMTDGLFHPGYSLEETFLRVVEIGAKSYCEKVTDYYNEHGLRIDDMSAVLIRL